ncbi:ABC transporter ATP-binding protein [Leucobacter sp. 1207-22]|uniref:ABC transporter ATP-binding protein n=1 Tax=Leucobacter sp. 1207-22 TaxID=2604456 RepID=UPI0040642953
MARKSRTQSAVAEAEIAESIEEEFTPGELDGDMFGNASAKKAKHFWPSAKRLFGLLSPEKYTFMLVVLLVVASVVCTVIAPKILGQAMDVIFNGVRGDGIDFGHLSRLILLVLALYLVSSFLMWLEGYILNGLVMRVVYKLRQDIEEKINRLPLSYFDKQQRGDVLSRVTNDVDNIQQALQQGFSQLISSFLTVVGIIAMMFIVSWQLALIALIALPLSAIIAGIVGVRAQKLFAAQWKSTGELNGHIEESFTGHELVRIFNRDREMAELFDERNERLYNSAFKAQSLSGSIMPSMQFVSYLCYVLIAVVGALRVTAGQLTLGDVTAFIQYSREFSQPLGEMAGLANMMQSGIASAERTFELMDADEEAPDSEASTKTHLPERTSGRVVFENVSFSYTSEKPLIQDLSLEAEPGNTVAIVGPTGAGKTTLVNLIMRFYELDGGRITLDGVDITELSRAELRGHVGMVLQDAWLFKGTIRENIRYGRLDATDDEIIEAAQATMVDRFVRQLPEGYDTVIDENGSSLSTGERQLLTIARAFIARPSLLILDEATSSVDTRTEVLVQKAMQTLRQDRTSFVIAHRLSTIRDADTILMMESGRIVEQGTHEDLLERDGAYAALHMAQFAGTDADEADPGLDESGASADAEGVAVAERSANSEASNPGSGEAKGGNSPEVEAGS